MIARNEIDTIETFFEQYCSYQSDIMFNYHTDRFFDNILSLGFVKDVVDTLMIKYPIDENELACRQCLEWFSFYKEIISQGHEYYLSDCIHYFQYLRNKDCLLVFTDEELIFHNVPEGIIAISTYIGDKTPSKRDKVVSIEF